MLTEVRIIPAVGIAISTIVDDVVLNGEIAALYPNDMTVTLKSPVTGLSSSLHVPYFAMGHHRLATLDGRRTCALTPYGLSSAEWLLQRCYEYSRGKHAGWPVDGLGPSGWIRLPNE